MKSIVDKEVEVLVSFAGGRVEAGSVPICYYGKVIEEDKDFVTIDCKGSRYASPTIIVINPTANIDSTGILNINKQYIIYIKEK